LHCPIWADDIFQVIIDPNFLDAAELCSFGEHFAELFTVPMLLLLLLRLALRVEALAGNRERPTA
jgi:hypothetical protein